MKKIERPLSQFVIRNLMLEALGSETFKKHHNSGRQSNLFKIVEELAIDKGMIEKQVNIPLIAWGTDSHILYSGNNTNFIREEIESLFAVFWMLLNQQVVAPGSYGESPNLPQFHVTQHGVECIKAKEILPYDIDGYLSKIRSVPGLDEWVKNYMNEAVKCFNSNCNHAATIMIGLAAEKLTLDLIDSFINYLQKNNGNITVKGNFQYKGSIDVAFTNEIKGLWQISHKYNKFNDYYNGITNHPQKIIDIMDNSSRKVFQEFTRMTRNEVSHPNDLEKSNTETLLLFVSFSKYIGIVTSLSNKFNSEVI